MKKILFLLMLCIGVMNFGNTRESYGSIRFFDKLMDIVMTGNIEKYKNDADMQSLLGEEGNKFNNTIDLYRDLMGVKKYQILSVTEGEKESKLRVRVTHEVIDEMDYQGFKNSIEKYMEKNKDELDEKKIVAEMMEIFDKYTEYKLETQEVDVYLKKDKNVWMVDERNLENEKFAYVLMSRMFSMIQKMTENEWD